MDHGSHDTAAAATSGMDMGGGCKISMLWNWTTVDACFLGSDWHVRSKGGFAGTIIGIFLLAIAIEAVRRAHREYDKRLIAQRRPLLTAIATPTHALTKDDSSDASPSTPLRSSVRQAGPTMGQQAIRAGFFGLQFAGAFTLMLIDEMYFNGYVILTIYLGMAVGYFFFAGDTLLGREPVVAGCGC